MKLTLRTKLVLRILPVFLGIVITSSLFVIYMTQRGQRDLAFDDLSQTTHSYANQLDAEMRAFQATGEAMAGYLKQYPGSSRDEINGYLQHLVEADLSLAGAFVIYEPDAFDRQDTRYANTGDYDATGRFAVYWNRVRVPGQVTAEPPGETDLTGFYQAAKATQNDMILEPTIQGQAMSVRFVFPIVKDGEFAGAAGIDASPSSLNQTVSNIQPFASSYAFLVSNSGSFLSFNKEKSLVGTATLDGWGQQKQNTTLSAIAQKIKIRADGSQEAPDPFSGKASVFFFAPVTTTGWGLVIATPIDEIMSWTIMLRNLLLSLAALAMLFLIVYVWWIANTIARPIQAIRQAARQVAAGDLEIDLRIRSKDEIAETAASFQEMTDHLRGIARAAQHIADGDLTETVEPQSPKDVLGNAFVQMVTGLNRAIRRVTENASQVQTASDRLAATAQQSRQATNQIANTIQQIARGTNEQTVSVNETVTAIEQMNQSIQELVQGAHDQSDAIERASNLTGQISNAIEQVSQSAQAVTRFSENAENSARQGSETVAETIREIQAIQQKVGYSVEKVTDMGQRSKKIGAIVDTIDDIASQTNLLAINAAIETAQAEIQADKLTEAILDRQMTIQAQLLNHILQIPGQDFSPVYWSEMARAAGLDSICITDSDGVIVYCNDPKITGWRFPDDPKEQAYVFRKLIHMHDGVVCQKAQVRSVDHTLFKYVGVSRQDQPGVVQVGFQADSLSKFRMKLGGFAVVAEEVRKLSDKSKSAAKEISTLIRDIQQTVTEAIAAMNEGAREVESGTRCATDSGQALQSILKTVRDVLAQAQQAAHAAQSVTVSVNELVTAMDGVSAVVEANSRATGQISEGSVSVRQAIESIAAISEQNSAAVQEVSASAEEVSGQVDEVSAAAQVLAKHAAGLRQVVAQFRLKEETRQERIAPMKAKAVAV